MASENQIEEQKVSINLAVLYATVMIIFGTILSEWPPDGQKEYIPVVVGDLLMVTLGAISVLIFFRIVHLIWVLEEKPLERYIQNSRFAYLIDKLRRFLWGPA